MRFPKGLASWILFVVLLTEPGYGAMGSSFNQLFVSVKSEVVLTQQGNDAIHVTIRLTPQNKASVWVQDRCESPQANSYLISQSGSFLIPLSAIGSQGDVNVCLASFDGSLNASLHVVNKLAGHLAD